MSQKDLRDALDILESVLSKRSSLDFRADLNSRPHVIPLSDEFMFELIGGQDYVQRRQQQINDPELQKLLNSEDIIRNPKDIQDKVRKSILKVSKGRVSDKKSVEGSGKGVYLENIRGVGQALVIKGFTNNYAVVRKIFTSAFNKTNLGESAYNTLGAVYGFRGSKEEDTVQDFSVDPDGEGGLVNSRRSVAIDVGHLFASAAVNITDSRKGLARRLDYIGKTNTLFDPSKGENIHRVAMLKAIKESVVNTATEGVFNLDARLSLVRKLASSKGRYTDLLEGKLVVVFPQAARENQAFGRTLAKLENNIVKQVESQLLDKLPNLRGSKSYVELLEEVIDATLEGRDIIKSAVSSAQKTIKIRTTNIEARLKPAKVAVPKFNISTAIIKSKNVNRLKQGGKFASLGSLLAHINALLPKYIQDNMGKGGARTVLNYRSGRFAKSAKLYKLDITRANAIDIMYSYMKYPYQTFEPGFRQGQIRSRDPRVLIQKSIRQIVTDSFGRDLNIRFTRT